VDKPFTFTLHYITFLTQHLGVSIFDPKLWVFEFKLSTKPFHVQTSISLYIFPVHNFHLWDLREYVNMDNADSKGLINLGGRVKVGLVEAGSLCEIDKS